jgi:hypothetical protein
LGYRDQLGLFAINKFDAKVLRVGYDVTYP